MQSHQLVDLLLLSEVSVVRLFYHGLELLNLSHQKLSPLVDLVGKLGVHFWMDVGRVHRDDSV